MPKLSYKEVSTFGIERIKKVHYLYILQSRSTGKYYIGETNNIENRLRQHTSKRTAFGKRNFDIELVYKREFENRSNAKKLESFLKRQKSHLFIDKIIAGKLIIPR